MVRESKLTDTQRAKLNAVFSALVGYYCEHKRGVMVKDLAPLMGWSENKVRSVINLESPEVWSIISTNGVCCGRGYTYAPTKAALADLFLMERARADDCEVRADKAEAELEGCQINQCKPVNKAIKPAVMGAQQAAELLMDNLKTLSKHLWLDEVEERINERADEPTG